MTAQMRNGCFQPVSRNGLDEKIQRKGPVRFQSVFFISRYKYDENARKTILDFLRKLQPAQSGHINIQKYRIRARALHSVPCLPRIGKHADY